MSQRRILVIGSQCEALGDLAFLPQAARELYAVMTDPHLGTCVSAIDGDGLLIDPTVKETKDAIKTAYRRAAKDRATLFIAYIGHGVRSEFGEDYYLLPKDAANPPDSDTAVHLVNLIKEAHSKTPGETDGLGVLVDACYSGSAGFGAAQAWVSGLRGTLRFEMLTAAAELPAANGCFSRTLVELLREGVAIVPSNHLECRHLRELIEGSCPNQVPQHPSYNPDGTLWLARNVGRSLEPWARTPLADEIERLTLAYQATPALSEVVTRSEEQHCLALVGEAGVGKSALAAALAWPKVAEEAVPAGFAQAIALFTEATTPQELARTLSAQLERSVKGFREAQQALDHETPYAEQRKLGALEKKIVGPLKRLASDIPVRLVFDGLDRLPTGAHASVMSALDELAQLEFVRLIVTARPDTTLPEAASIYTLPRASGEAIRLYLERREIPSSRQPDVVASAEGSWLVARVLADLLRERPDAEIRAEGQLTLTDAYDEMLLRSGADSDNATRKVLAALAAAGAGPVFPLSLLCAASKALGGPDSVAGVRDQLVKLRGLAVRSAAGTEREHAGLFHQTLAEHVVAHAPDENRAAHRAIIASIEALAPVVSGPVDLSDPSQRYALEREAEHLWALGETDEALASLSARTSPMPHDNLQRWQRWFRREEATYGPDHPETLRTRSNIAIWTGECGETREALRLFEKLVADRERVLGPDHPDTLETHTDIAQRTGFWSPLQALQLFKKLLPRQKRVLGRDHPVTLKTRSNIANLAGALGYQWRMLQLLKKLLPSQKQVLGYEHPYTLATRHNIALCTSHCGETREALRLLEELLPDMQRALGPDHPDTFGTRNSIAACAGECGNAREALRLFEELLNDERRALGPDHPVTLTTRSNIAGWTGECGNAREALRLFGELLLDQQRVLGPDHPETLGSRHNIAYWTGECGNAREALRLFEKLLPDERRALGPDHPITLETQRLIDYFSKR